MKLLSLCLFYHYFNFYVSSPFPQIFSDIIGLNNVSLDIAFGNETDNMTATVPGQSLDLQVRRLSNKAGTGDTGETHTKWTWYYQSTSDPEHWHQYDVRNYNVVNILS